jgi:hypothetical protein
MPQGWQEIDALCHCCHWWQDLVPSMITAMNILPFLATVFVILATAYLVFALVHFVANDGVSLRHRTPPRSHPADEFERHSHFA